MSADAQNPSLADLLADAKERIENLTAEWIRTTNLKKLVNKLLEEHTSAIVQKLLGFDNRFGGWEVDHCNGRAGESAAGDFLRQKARETVKAWLEKQAGNLPELDKKAVASLMSEYHSQLYQLVSVEVTRLAHQRSAEVIDKLAESLVPPLEEK